MKAPLAISMHSRRIHELDWLRIFAILAVFLHHVCQPFNGDGWHIMNAETSKVLDDIMVYFEQCRLPILFLISGAGSVILLSRRRKKAYVGERMQRLLIPLIVGVVLIIPPQTYIEHIDSLGPYWQAYPQVLARLEVNHLWFIEYLVVFAMLAVLLNEALKSQAGLRLIGLIKKMTLFPLGFFLPALLFALIRVILKFYFPGYELGITNLASSGFYFLFFFAGMVLISDSTLWDSIRQKRRENLIIAVVCSIAFYAYYFPDLSGYLSHEVRWSLWWVATTFVSWSVTLTLLGYGGAYLNFSTPWLVKANELIYPFYIFHQTVIIVLGYIVIHTAWSIAAKIGVIFAIALPITVALCLYIVYPFNVVRFFFGLKQRERAAAPTGLYPVNTPPVPETVVQNQRHKTQGRI